MESAYALSLAGSDEQKMGAEPRGHAAAGRPGGSLGSAGEGEPSPSLGLRCFSAHKACGVGSGVLSVPRSGWGEGRWGQP